VAEYRDVSAEHYGGVVSLIDVSKKLDEKCFVGIE